MNVILIPDIHFSPVFSISTDFRFSRLKERGIRELLDFHNTYCAYVLFSAEDVESRIKQGHRCYLAHKGEELVGFAWFGVNSIYSPDLFCTFKFLDNCVFGYNYFIRPDCRGKNLLPGITQIGFRDFSVKGYKKCYTYNMANNESVMRSIKKFKGYVIGKITYGYLFAHYIFVPCINCNEDITVKLNVGPWHRWHSFYRKRFVRKAVIYKNQ